MLETIGLVFATGLLAAVVVLLLAGLCLAAFRAGVVYGSSSLGGETIPQIGRKARSAVDARCRAYKRSISAYLRAYREENPQEVSHASEE